MALTIGEVAGLINVGVVLLQLTFPLALVFILVGVIANENNAVTWSVIGRILNGSFWSTILSSDTAATTKVSRRCTFISFFSTAGLILLAAASVITPLGLYEVIAQERTDNLPFVYARDLSPLGGATPSRADYNISRLCGWLMFLNCPGQGHGFYYTHNATGDYINWDNDTAYISSVPPDNLTQIFSSGSKGDRETVASPFDLQFRTYALKNNPDKQSSLILTAPPFNIDQQRQRTVGGYQTYESLILADDFVVREGLVADMVKGGIGFRNHTIPANPLQGVEWTEGLLWVEPESVCISNNITIRFTLPIEGQDQQNFLIDDGGVALLSKDYPYIDLNQTQFRPELYARAHKGAVLANNNLRLYLNVSRSNASYVGRNFTLPSGSLIEPGLVGVNSFDLGIPGVSLGLDPRENITLIDSIDMLTQGYGGKDTANISHIAAGGGLVRGPPVRIGGKGNDRYDPGTDWASSVHSCSTVLRAYIMDVTFFINGTGTLDNLKVRKAQPRTYDTNATTPLWAIEDTGGMNISDVTPIWGLVDDKYEKAPNMWTVRRDYLYLPAGYPSFNLGELAQSDSMACGAPEGVLSALYSSLWNNLGSVYPNYLGNANYPLSLKWANLTTSAATIPTMLSLVWTDVMANLVMGSRSQLNANYSSTINPGQQQSKASQLVQALSYDRQIRYKLRYSIPAVIFLAFYCSVILTALLLWITRRSTFSILGSLLNQTSLGRAITVERHKTDPEPQTMRTKDWIRVFGDEKVSISKKVSNKQQHSGKEYDCQPVVGTTHETTKTA